MIFHYLSTDYFSISKLHQEACGVDWWQLLLIELESEQWWRIAVETIPDHWENPHWSLARGKTFDQWLSSSPPPLASSLSSTTSPPSSQWPSSSSVTVSLGMSRIKSDGREEWSHVRGMIADKCQCNHPRCQDQSSLMSDWPQKWGGSTLWADEEALPRTHNGGSSTFLIWSLYPTLHLGAHPIPVHYDTSTNFLLGQIDAQLGPCSSSTTCCGSEGGGGCIWLAWKLSRG